MESKVMAKKNEMTHDDLMQLPNDIAGMVLEVQGRQTQPATPIENEQEELIQEQSTSAPATSKPTPEPTALPKEGNLKWNTFLKYGESYGYRVRKTGRKMYWIDDDIVEALKACDVNRMSATDMVNAILRAFIELNKGEFRECVKHRDSLI